MKTLEQWLSLASDCGFDHVGRLNVSALKFMPEVRSMCADDLCHSYGRNWTCPPGCGTLEEIAEQTARYSTGVLLQTTGQMEDDFDAETIESAMALQKERFFRFVEEVRKELPDCLPMAAGACTICPKCTYPDAPCRFPDRSMPSMEAYGLMVSQVCEASGVPYYYGKNTITYTSCVLLS